MRVGLNLLYLLPGRVGGSEIVAKQLVPALAKARPNDEFVAFTAREAAPVLANEGWPDNVRIRRLDVPGAIKPARVGVEMSLLPILAKRERLDVLHSLGTTHPVALGVPGVSTVLDLIYEHFPDTFPAPLRWGLRAVVGPGARSADRVMAISEAGKRDIVEHLRVPADKVDVVHLGFGMRPPPTITPEPELRDRYGLGTKRVILCVSAAFSHKNIPRLVEAFERLDMPDTHLVVVGHAGRDQEKLAELVRAGGLDDRVTFTGWISAEDLEGLYTLASCCAYPSLFEGFGLPVLEAMARDKPLACSNLTSLPEVAGDAAELFDPLDVDAITAALQRVLTDDERAAELVARGRERVKHFTWERCAEACLAVYDRAMA
jgi:glycosyltransferase involved in cell wall biosynthesis